MNELSTHNLSMVYRTAEGQDVHALEDINFRMSEHDLVTVLGASGCGKTTLLNIIAGFLSPTAGEAVLDGRPITGPGPERGMVFQQGALFEWLTVAENVDFGPRMMGVPRRQREQTVAHLLDIVGLSKFRDTPIYQLSGGMQQRVALIRCLANDPSVMLMDEPLGALDALTRERMQTMILRLWRETGKMIFFITHSVEEALYLGSRVFVMAPRPGKIIKEYQLPFAKEGPDADPRDIKSSAEFIRVREEVLRMIWSMEDEEMAAGADPGAASAVPATSAH